MSRCVRITAARPLCLCSGRSRDQIDLRCVQCDSVAEALLQSIGRSELSTLDEAIVGFVMLYDQSLRGNALRPHTAAWRSGGSC